MAQISTPKQVRGWITPTLFALVSALSCIGRCIIPSAELKGDPSPAQALEQSEARAKFVDTFVAACMGLGWHQQEHRLAHLPSFVWDDSQSEW